MIMLVFHWRMQDSIIDIKVPTFIPGKVRTCEYNLNLAEFLHFMDFAMIDVLGDSYMIGMCFVVAVSVATDHQVLSGNIPVSFLHCFEGH